VAVSFIGGGNWDTRRKPPNCPDYAEIVEEEGDYSTPMSKFTKY
jgi:hypothetical protein